MNWVFPLRFRYYQIEYFYGFENTWCMYCYEYPWWQWGIILIHLIWVLALNSRIIEVTLGNLCIGVDARSRLCFSDRNLGALFEVLCVGLNIMNLNSLWCYFSTNSWLDRLERIASCYFSTNSRIDWSERIALRWFHTLQTISSYVLH